ncbi:MAG: hypothetical protein DRJ35_01315 [Thermoprotei archaeon]|nr:MAG: hypothetical protein DRJ35_01315 [Thermoprotei archaeon]
MLRDFNLVASTYRMRENDCISELWFFAKEIGDKSLDASKTGLPSLIVAKTSLDPEHFVKTLREKVLENPWLFRYLLKIVPIQENVEADIELIVDVALKLAREKLQPGETYRIDVRHRLSDISKMDVVEKLAPKIENKVDLENPDKIILVEIIGDIAGVSVIPPELIVSITKLKRLARQRDLKLQP